MKIRTYMSMKLVKYTERIELTPWDTFLSQRRDKSTTPADGLLLYIPSLWQYYSGFQRVRQLQRGRCYRLLTISSTICCKCVPFVWGLGRRVSFLRLAFWPGDVSSLWLLSWIRRRQLPGRSSRQARPWLTTELDGRRLKYWIPLIRFALDT